VSLTIKNSSYKLTITIITSTKLKAPLTFILVMMVLFLKTCIDLFEQCVTKIEKKTCLLIGIED